ncbi:hypothetical protein RRG08_011875 [Elysia crispata]|uniref:Uncharacterized protein n=1 Tax=Elysia crispata TaxID=231223 RepID=A0AAE1DIP5_9GAST|nr:hypothetical protein RRG08_011875 [Elysia crispata]
MGPGCRTGRPSPGLTSDISCPIVSGEVHKLPTRRIQYTMEILSQTHVIRVLSIVLTLDFLSDQDGKERSISYIRYVRMGNSAVYRTFYTEYKKCRSIIEIIGSLTGGVGDTAPTAQNLEEKNLHQGTAEKSVKISSKKKQRSSRNVSIFLDFKDRQTDRMADLEASTIALTIISHSGCHIWLR